MMMIMTKTIKIKIMIISLVLKSAIFENGKYQHFLAICLLSNWLRATNMPEWGIPEKSIKNVAQRR